MRKDKDQAIRLRKAGRSYSQINKLLAIPKSTLSGWLKDIEIDDALRKRIDSRAARKSREALIKRNKMQTDLAARKANEIRKQAMREAEQYMGNPLFIAGCSLYWAEGYKKGAQGSKWKCVDFTNSDPEMIKLMMKFFRIICKIDNEKFKLQLIVHQNIDMEKALNYWSDLTKISSSQFIKTYCGLSKASKQKRNRVTLTYGTLHIRIYDVKLFFRIVGWIDGLKKNFIAGVAQW